MFLEGSIVFLDVGTWGIWIMIDSPGTHAWPSTTDKETEAQESWIMKLWAFHSTYSQTFFFNKFFIF